MKKGRFATCLVMLSSSLAFFLAMLLHSDAVRAATLCEETRAAAGDQFSIFLTRDLTAVGGFGRNESGQLGSAIVMPSRLQVAPAPVATLVNLQAVAAGGYHSLALTTTGEVWTWGNGEQGQLGDGANLDVNPDPRRVLGLPPVISIAGADAHSLAVDASGQVWAWGENTIGELGDGTTNPSNVPVLVQGFTGAQAVSGSFYYSLALKGNGTVWGWGTNHTGQLGTGNFVNSLTPVQTAIPAPVIAIAAGSVHALALRADGKVWGWGNNEYGQLGRGAINWGTPWPGASVLSGTAVAIAAGMLHSLALLDDGTVWAFGSNQHGQLGNGGNSPVANPERVVGLAGIVAIAAGPFHSLAIHSDGSVWAWGENSLGALGDGTWISSNVPVKMQLDMAPPKQGNVLRAVKVGDDVALEFRAAPPAASWRLYGDRSKELQGLTALTPDATVTSHVDPGVVTRSGDLYYILRGLSLCTQTPGLP